MDTSSSSPSPSVWPPISSSFGSAGPSQVSTGCVVATDVKVKLQALAEAALAKIVAAQEAHERTATLADGTVLKAAPTTVGPCLSVVMHLPTGTVYYGQNTGQRAAGLVEPLASRTQAVIDANQQASRAPKGFGPGWTRLRGYPGSHSEVVALNQGLQRHAGSQPSDFAVYNIRTEDNDERGEPMPRCGNCEPITDGIIALTD
jgi:hypothetical protein